LIATQKFGTNPAIIQRLSKADNLTGCFDYKLQVDKWVKNVRESIDSRKALEEE